MELATLSGFQKVGASAIAFVGIAWLAFLAFQLFKSDREPGSEIEYAPNRKPYYDDEILETKRLDRFLGFAFFFLAISAVALPVYYLNETTRQANAISSLNHDAIDRGAVLYTNFCSRCHSAGGVGGSVSTTVSSNPLDKTAPPRPVTWTAPPLNTVLLRYTDNQVESVIEYGRLNTPMPPWSVKGGGAMNDQNVTDLISYLHSIQLTSDKAQAQTQQAGVTGYVYPYQDAPGNDGAKLFARYCSRCHTKGWSYGEPDVIGGGAYGPNLTGGSVVRQFPRIEDQIDFITNGAFTNNTASVFDGPLPAFKPYAYGVRGIGVVEGGGMPAFGKMLSADQITAIAQYERSLGVAGPTPAPTKAGGK